MEALEGLELEQHQEERLRAVRKENIRSPANRPRGNNRARRDVRRPEQFALS